VGTRSADHVNPLYPQKLALTSPTSSGRSVGIVRLRTKSHRVFFFCSGRKSVILGLCCGKTKVSEPRPSMEGSARSRPAHTHLHSASHLFREQVHEIPTCRTRPLYTCPTVGRPRYTPTCRSRPLYTCPAVRCPSYTTTCRSKPFYTCPAVRRPRYTPPADPGHCIYVPQSDDPVIPHLQVQAAV
jgi:hypothetical protein